MSKSSSSAISTVGRIIVSAIVIVGFYVQMYIWITHKIGGGEASESLSLMVGASITAFTLAIQYWIGSSSGSSDKDTAQQATTDRLVEAVSTSTPGRSESSASKQIRWANLSPEEKGKVSTAASTDTRVARFIVDAQGGGATQEELDYLASKDLIAADRGGEIKKAGET